jgi:hypothetical protein
VVQDLLDLCCLLSSEFFSHEERCFFTAIGVSAGKLPVRITNPRSWAPGLTDAREGAKVTSSDLTMSGLVEVELVEGPALYALSSELRSFGYLLTCDRCKDSRELVSGILVIPGSGAAWALCGTCMRQMPRSHGQVV